MWKKNFTIKVDAHPFDGMETVSLYHDDNYWYIGGLDINALKLPKDDNVLSQIISVCEQIINHDDNPLNAPMKRQV